VLVVGQGDSQRRLAAVVRRMSCHVRLPNDRRQLLDLVSAGRCDLVVVDGDSLGYDDAELLGEIRDAGSAPAIVISSASTPPDVARWLDRGAAGVVGVPIDPLILAASVRQALRSGARLRQEEARLQQLRRETLRYQRLSQVVVPIGIALSVDRDFGRLLEVILLESMALCGADGGTHYLRTDDDRLTFEITRNTSLGIATGGTTGAPNTLPPLTLYDEQTGQPNYRNVATYVALRREPVNIPDAYQAEGFDFTGTRAFDRITGYRSTSFLTCPLVGSDQRLIGVLQLINAVDRDSGRVTAFDPGLEHLLQSMATLAVVALESYLREAKLRLQLDDLMIEIDERKKASETAEITETSYFESLVSAVREYRAGGSAELWPGEPESRDETLV
jgi:DNA-binding response OmpR family regulator